MELTSDVLSECRLSTRGNHILRLKPEVIDWCKENGIRYKKSGSKLYFNGLSFYSPEDAIAFKLRWLGGAPIGTFGVGTSIQ